MLVSKSTFVIVVGTIFSQMMLHIIRHQRDFLEMCNYFLAALLHLYYCISTLHAHHHKQ